MNACQHDFDILSLISLLWSDIIFYTECEMSLVKGRVCSFLFLYNVITLRI